MRALAQGHPIDLAVLARVPKFDSRSGFLFLDEPYVSPAWRHRGAGSALVGRAVELAQELDLAGLPSSRASGKPGNPEILRVHQATRVPIDLVRTNV